MPILPCLQSQSNSMKFPMASKRFMQAIDFAREQDVTELQLQASVPLSQHPLPDFQPVRERANIANPVRGLTGSALYRFT